MCELYGFSGKKKKILNPELREFYSHSPNQPDGWGLAVFSGAESYIRKGPEPAAKSRELEQLLEVPVCTADAIAHIRRATIGYDTYHNSHPFWGGDISGRIWTLIHNGTIFESDLLGEYQYQQKGSTDSERLFLCLLDQVNQEIIRKEHALSAGERCEVTDRVIRAAAPRNKLNLIIFDGEQMYVHSNCRGTLHQREDADGITFSTVPLKEGRWDPAPFLQVCVYQGGRLVWAGTLHEEEYLPEEKNIRALYLAYSGL